jgi:hypothetical protein
MALAIPPSALPGISPSRGEIESRLPIAPLSPFGRRLGECAQPISPIEEEMPGRAEGGSPISGKRLNQIPS